MDPHEIASSNAAAQQPQIPGAESTTPPAQANDQNPENEWANRFSTLTLRERKLMQKEKELKEKLSRLDRLESLREDPDALLGEFGHSYDTLTQRRLANPKTPVEQSFESLQQEVMSLKQALAKRDESEQQTAQQQQLQKLFQDVDSMLEQGGEKYETIRAFGESKLVLDTAAQYFTQTGRHVSLEEAAGWVEQFLEQRVEKLRETKKYGAKFLPNSADAPASPGQQAVQAAAAAQTEARQSDATLTSGMAQSAAPAGSGAGEKPTERILRQRAIEALKSGGWQ